MMCFSHLVMHATCVPGEERVSSFLEEGAHMIGHLKYHFASYRKILAVFVSLKMRLHKCTYIDTYVYTCYGISIV